MQAPTLQGMNAKIKPRIEKYGPGETPGIDEPDEVFEGPEREEILFGKDAEFIRDSFQTKATRKEKDHGDN